MRIIALFALAFSLLLAGCTTTTIASYPWYAKPPVGAHRKLVVVIDGTHNDPSSHTNAFRLHELITNQNRDDISTFYTEGVGSDARVLGMATGAGMARDVRDAYRFLAEHWQPGDEIYIIGFSRGAYAGRILSGLIYTAGLVDLSNTPKLDQRRAIVDRLSDAAKLYARNGESAVDWQGRRADRVAKVLAKLPRPTRPDVPITAVAYWDTVAAMGMPDGETDPVAEDRALPYLDQFCNVGTIIHALSLDDNRPKDFTPMIATGPERRALCPGKPESDFEEVWFSGAHADVGGTYREDDDATLEGNLPGVSLNWMIARLARFGLTPPGAGQYADPLDIIHDARRALMVYRFRHDASRNVFGLAEQSRYNRGRPKIHISVEQRLSRLFLLDARAGGQCGDDTPKLICRQRIESSKFFVALKDGCLEPAFVDGATEQTGWRFAGTRTPVTGKPEVETRCVTLVYDR